MQLPSVVALVGKSPKENISEIQEFVDLFLKHEMLKAENDGSQQFERMIQRLRQENQVAVSAVGGAHAFLPPGCSLDLLHGVRAVM